MTEQQPYDVIAQYPGFELRRYPAHVVAETTVGGGFESAGNKAFRSLANYIGGRNTAGRKIAMTAPVVQAAAGAGQHVVGFVMPAADASLPEPVDPHVALRSVPVKVAAAHRFSGLWSRAVVERATSTLLADAEKAGLTVSGPVQFARFDPPWTPWFLRHNEVVAPVADLPT